jgi:hypothetical protein
MGREVMKLISLGDALHAIQSAAICTWIGMLIGRLLYEALWGGDFLIVTPLSIGDAITAFAVWWTCTRNLKAASP